MLEEGKLTVSEEGTPQGGSASSLPANIYLHYVFDLWAEAWRRKIARRDILVLRFADDIVMGLQEKIEAEQFWSELTVRPGAAPGENAAAGVRPFCGGATAEALRRETGNFQLLGFTHIGGKTRKGRFSVIRQTIRKRMQAKLKAIKIGLRRRMRNPLKEQGQWLRAVVGGHIRYYGVPGSRVPLRIFRWRVERHWHRLLSRRSQSGYMPWERMRRLLRRWLPQARICYSYPSLRASS